MAYARCAACGCDRDGCSVDEISNHYSEKVQKDYEERNYKSYNHICFDCLDETESLFNGDEEDEETEEEEED